MLSQLGDQRFPKQLIARSLCTFDASASVRGKYNLTAFTSYQNTEKFSLTCYLSNVVGVWLAHQWCIWQWVASDIP